MASLPAKQPTTNEAKCRRLSSRAMKHYSQKTLRRTCKGHGRGPRDGQWPPWPPPGLLVVPLRRCCSATATRYLALLRSTVTARSFACCRGEESHRGKTGEWGESYREREMGGGRWSRPRRRPPLCCAQQPTRSSAAIVLAETCNSETQ
jgi:hypothetical protein